MAELTVRVDVPDPPEFKTRLDGLVEALRPDGTVRARVMVPVNPF